MIQKIKNLLGLNRSEQIQDFLDRGALIIDVRSGGEFASGHIRGAKNIPLAKVPDQAAVLAKTGKPIIVCCASGMRSAQAKSVLQNKGIEVLNAGSWTRLSSYIN